MPNSNHLIREIILTRVAREALSGEDICQALAEHQPEKYFSLHSGGQKNIVVVTDDDGLTRVMVSSD